VAQKGQWVTNSGGYVAISWKLYKIWLRLAGIIETTFIANKNKLYLKWHKN